jgi:hypothetical protein
MTQIKFKSDINATQMNFLLFLFKTWNVETEIEQENTVLQNTTFFPKTEQALSVSTETTKKMINKTSRGYLTHEQFVEKSNREIDALCKEYGIL